MQLSETQAEIVKRQLLTMQIISGGLLVGATTFMLIILAISWAEPWALELDVLPVVGIMFGVGAGIGSLVVVKIVFDKQIQLINHNANNSETKVVTHRELTDSRVQAIMEKCHAFQIIRMALVEGAIFFNLIVFMLAKNWLSLVIVGFLFVLMLILFPTRGKIENVLEIRSLI